jgi:hypothetical protein
MAAWAARNADASQPFATKPRAGYCAVRGDDGFQARVASSTKSFFTQGV